MVPVITRPMRITQSSLTLIDNIYISTGLQKIHILHTGIRYMRLFTYISFIKAD